MNKIASALGISITVMALLMTGCAAKDETAAPTINIEQIPSSGSAAAGTSAAEKSTAAAGTETAAAAAAGTTAASAPSSSNKTGNADKQISSDTVWITVEASYVTDAGSWTADSFGNAERFTIKKDGTWSCEAPEGDILGGTSGTWTKTDGDTISLVNSNGGSGNSNCTIKFAAPEKGEATLTTQYGNSMMIRTDTECGSIATQLFDKVLGK